MPDLVTLLRDGATNLWIFIPTAILLGALHGLEPGHSKTMMAAFIKASNAGCCDTNRCQASDEGGSIDCRASGTSGRR